MTDHPTDAEHQDTPFGRNIRQLRKNAGLTQEELAAQTGISQSHISALERGVYHPQMDNLQSLSRVFGVSMEDLAAGKPTFGGEGTAQVSSVAGTGTDAEQTHAQGESPATAAEESVGEKLLRHR